MRIKHAAEQVFSREFVSIEEHCKRSGAEQNEYLRRLCEVQDRKETKLGADLFGLWVLSAREGDMKTHSEVAIVMAQFSKRANGVKP